MDTALLLRRHRRIDKGRECWLVKVDDTNGNTVLTVTNHTEDITYDGDTYTAYNLTVEPSPMATDGCLPVGRLRVSNVLRALQASLYAGDFWRNYPLQIVAYNVDEPAADYSSETKSYTIVSHETDLQDVILTYSVPGELLAEVPEDSYGPSCRHRFGSQRCGYTIDQPIVSISLPSGLPVSVEVTGHPFETGDLVTLDSVVGITPDINDDWVVTWVDANHFTLDDTDGDDYAGSPDPGALAGFAVCGKFRRDCRRRGQGVNFGNCPGLRPDALRVTG